MNQSTPKFDIDLIVDYLNRHKRDLPNIYQWSPNLERLVTLEILGQTEFDLISNQDLTPYQQEVFLKELIGNVLNDSFRKDLKLFRELCLWVIKDWGGITSARDSDTLEILNEFLINENKPFNRIASTSKVASFMSPEKFVIYDSRVAYTLNWIILSQNAGNTYFPIPEGRNSKMMAFDMNVLIRLKNISNYQVSEVDGSRFINNRDKNLFIPKNNAYTELNKLIKQISGKLWNGEKAKKLYYTEMLLFSIADKQIYEDITKRILFAIKG